MMTLLMAEPTGKMVAVSYADDKKPQELIRSEGVQEQNP